MVSAATSPALPGLVVLEQTPIILERLLVAATDEQLYCKPSADRWSISEVLAHLTEVEEVTFRHRVQLMMEQESPRIEPYDQNAAYAAGKYSGGRAREHLKRFCHERDRTLSWLRYVPPDVIARTGQHGELGRITVGELMHEWAFHDLGHIRQIAELYLAYAFYPRMGPFQRYYTVKP